MKILFIHHGVVLGGAPLSLLYLARELEQLPDIDLAIACHSLEMREFFSKNLKSPIGEWTNPHTHIVKFLIGWIGWDGLFKNSSSYKRFIDDFLRFPFSVLKQMNAFKKLKPDVVHLNSATLLSSAIAASIVRLPIVWHIREPLQGPHWQQRIMGYIIRKLAKAVVAISEEEASRLGTDREKRVHVIYNPINVDKLKPERYQQRDEKKKLGLLETDKLVVSLGGFNPRKGTLEIIEAMKYVDANTYLFIAGPPLIENHVVDLYASKIRTVLDTLPTNKVKFLGNIEDIVPLLAACDLLIFAGTKPHFPRPVFEAWQMEKPVAVFEMPGISAQVKHQVNGFIVNDLNGYSLGKAISHLFKDMKLLNSMGKNGRKKAEEKCNPVSVAKQVLQVYKEILN